MSVVEACLSSTQVDIIDPVIVVHVGAPLDSCVKTCGVAVLLGVTLASVVAPLA